MGANPDIMLAMRMTGPTASGSKPIVPIAMGWTLPIDVLNTFEPWIRPRARFMAAFMYAEAELARLDINEEHRIHSKAITEAIGTYLIKEPATMREVEAAQQTMVRTITSKAIEKMPFSRQLRYIIAQSARHASDATTIITQDTRSVLPPGAMFNVGQTINARRLYLFSRQLHALPKTMWAPALQAYFVRAFDTAATVNELTDIEVASVNLSDDVDRVWASLTRDEYAAYLEFQTSANESTAEQFMAACVFLTATSLVRGQTVTDAWVDNRVRSMSTVMQGLTDNPYVQRQVIEHYNLMHPREQLDTMDVTRMVYTLYAMAGDLQIPPFQWLLEQATCINLTALVTIAECASESSVFNYKLLNSKFGIPEIEFKHVVDMSYDVLRNPFCAIAKPRIPAANYPGLAILARAYKLERGGTVSKDARAFRAYASVVQGTARGDPAHFQQLAKKLRQIAHRQVEESASIENLIDVPEEEQGNFIYKTIGDSLFKIPTTTAATEQELRRIEAGVSPATLGLVPVMGEAREYTSAQGNVIRMEFNEEAPAGVEVRTVQAVVGYKSETPRVIGQSGRLLNIDARADWSPDAQDLPHSAIKISAKDVANMLAGETNERTTLCYHVE